MPEVVEAVAGVGEAGALEGGAPYAAVEVRLVQRRSMDSREDQLVRRIAAAFHCSGGEMTKGFVDRREERHRADTGLRLRPLEFAPRVGALDVDDAHLAIDVTPAKGAELAEAEASAERNVEETDCVVPAIHTVKTPWGQRLIPVDGLERFVREYLEPPREPGERGMAGRTPTLPQRVVERIRLDYARGRGLADIARQLNDDGIPTAHGGRQWWPSTVRAVLVRSSPPCSAEVNERAA
jgi:Recombinase